jgi:tetratricopeptide (TPR) repeat protein
VLVDVLGRGGMGTVWRAWQVDLRRWVAVKIVSTNDSDDLQRFHREAQTAARLTHANIAPVYESGAADGPGNAGTSGGRRNFIAMALVHGSPLDRLMRSPQRPGLRTLVEILRDASRAVHYAHGQGVVHRDLKPANIMVELDAAEPGATPPTQVRPGASTPRAFVMDFGLARSVQPGGSLTVSGMLVGTPAYMPPEQASGDPKRVGPASDVYALGATLYEVLAGTPPFTGDDVTDILVRLASDEPVPPRRRAPRTPVDLETVCLKAIEKEPARRYASAAEFADELTRWLDGEPILARPITGFTRLLRRIRKHKALSAATAAAVASLATGAVFLTLWLVQRSEQHARDRRRADALPHYQEAQAAFLRADRLRFIPSADVREYAPLMDAAERHARAAVERDASFADAWTLLAQLEWLRNAVDDAGRSADRAVAADPSHVSARLIRGRIRLDQFERNYGLLWFGLLSRGTERGGFELGFSRESKGRDELRRAIADDLAVAAKLSDKPYERAFADGLTAFVLWRPDRPDQLRLARESLLRAAELDRNEIEPIHQLALLEGHVGDVEASLRRFRDACRLAPNDPWVLYNYGATLRAAGQIAEARDAVDRAIALRPAPMMYNLRGLCRMATGEGDEAERDFERARADPRGAPWPESNLAWLYHRRGEHDRALDMIGALARRFPGEAEYPALRSGLLLEIGRLPEALVEAERARTLAPGDARFWTNVATVKSRMGRPDEAERDYRRALEIDPQSPHATTNYGVFLKNAGRLDEALALFQAAASRAPSDVRSRMDVADLERRMGRFEDAIASYTLALKLKPDAGGAHAGRGACLHELGRSAEARADVDAALAIDPRHPFALALRGVAHAQDGRYAEAERDLADAIAIEPTTDRRKAHGDVLSRLGRFAEAVDEYDRVIEAGPPADPTTWAGRAAARCFLGRREEAAADAVRALDAGLRLPFLHQLRGEGYLLKAEFEKAVADFDVALRSIRREPMLFAARGHARLALGRVEPALEDFEAALALKPDHASSLAGRGRARLRQGRRAEAAADLERAFELVPRLRDEFGPDYERAVGDR